MSEWLTLFLWLVLGHYVMDFWAQSNWLAQAKNRHRSPGEPPPGQKPQAVWPHALTAHAAHHGAAVAFITNNPALALGEWFVHWLIDWGKCENWYGIHEDQALHIACKAAWATVLVLR